MQRVREYLFKLKVFSTNEIYQTHFTIHHIIYYHLQPMENIKIDLNKLELPDINKLLVAIDTEITKLLPVAREAEIKYQLRFDRLMLDSIYSNQAQREAHARLTCDQEELYKPMLRSKGDLRELLNKKELLIEMARNIRHLLTNG